MAATLTIVQLAARCRHYRDRAAELFEVAGQWSATAEADALRVVLARLSTHASDHVTWWSQRLPSGEWPPVGSAFEEAGERAAQARAALREQSPTPHGLRRLCEVVDDLTDELRRWAAEHDADLDAPTVRVLELVLADLQRDGHDLHAIT